MSQSHAVPTSYPSKVQHSAAFTPIVLCGKPSAFLLTCTAALPAVATFCSGGSWVGAHGHPAHAADPGTAAGSAQFLYHKHQGGSTLRLMPFVARNAASPSSSYAAALRCFGVEMDPQSEGYYRVSHLWSAQVIAGGSALAQTSGLFPPGFDWTTLTEAAYMAWGGSVDSGTLVDNTRNSSFRSFGAVNVTIEFDPDRFDFLLFDGGVNASDVTASGKSPADGIGFAITEI
mgnify:CR=1 FL=1